MKRTAIELLYMALSLVGAALIAWLAAWSVPAARSVWDVAYVAMLVLLFMGIRPLRLALRADREAREAGHLRADG